jgi:penicillin amidase
MLLQFLLFLSIPALATDNPVASSLIGKKCNSWTDESKIRHVQTTDQIHAFACLGYFHALDRSWQMDFLKRVALGKKAEVTNYKDIKSDYFMRLLGLEKLAQNIFQKLLKEDQDLLWAYSFGANQIFKNLIDQKHPLPIEYKTLKYLPTLWHPSDSILLILLQSFDQTYRGFKEQIDQEHRKSDFGEGAKALFSNEGLPWSTNILKSGEYTLPEKKVEKVVWRNVMSPPSIDPASFPRPIAEGSNNWVIAPKKSQTGYAWIANDPHLELRRPPFWYWLHLKAKDSDVMGASVPGIPFFTTGTNRKVSWGLTTSYLPSTHIAYVPKTEMNISEIRPVIWFKFGFFKLPYFFKKIRRALHLPILPIEEKEAHELVLNWTGYDLEAKDFHYLFRAHLSANAKDFDQNMGRLGVPSWNFVFADQGGNIGYRGNGKIRKASEFVYGIPVETFANLTQKNFLSPNEMPHIMNPRRGFVVTANNRHWGSDSQFSIGEPFPKTFRAFRIEELMRETEQHNLDTVQNIQCDIQSVDARFLLPPLLKILKEYVGSEDVKAAYDLLKIWDFNTHDECMACSVYRGWVEEILHATALNENALYRELNKASAGLKQNVLKSLKKTLADFGIGKSRVWPHWKNIHQVLFPHLSGQDVFPFTALSTMGDKHSVNIAGGDWENGIYQQKYGATQRVIIEMSTPPKIFFALAGANIGASEPEDFTAWKACELHPLKFPLENFSEYSDIDPITLR